MAGQNGEPDPFGRRSVAHEREGVDPFESMREQMDRERDNFFRGVNPRDWPNEGAAGSRGGIFNRPRTSFAGFPSGPGLRGPRYANDFPTADEVEGFGLLPGSQSRQRKSSGGSGQCGPEDEGSDHSSSSSQSHPEQESVPIQVVHERGGPRHKYNTARNTTELPAKASSGNESPRLERAASEPPNKFAQRLNLSKPAYNTIPEGGEGNNGHYIRPTQLQDPRSADPTRPGTIKPSASAPSVPTQESQPVPPPRKSPPRPGNMAQPGVPTNSSNNVRHIPIFVEGRPEPIFNTNLKGAQADQPAAAVDPSLPKPSDYYPQGVQRLKSRDAALTPESPQLEPFKSGRQVVPLDEPTTPQGPPPGPIPMGYIPGTTLQPPDAPPEPTTPQGPPPGPIPMGYVPNQTQSVPDPQSQPPPPPQRTKSSSQVHNNLKEQLTVPQEHSGEEASKLEEGGAGKKRSPSPSQPQSSTQKTGTLEKDRKGSTEPVVNVVPIKVEGRSRGSSQEPRPGKSPTPARATPQPPSEPPSAPVDPKVAKLDKINEEVESLMEKIRNFRGSKQDKEYLYLDEMLTRHLIALDGIEPEGQSEIRQMRKESIKSVNMCLSLLDERCTAPS